MNKRQHSPENHALYRVMTGRALHWPVQGGKPQVWATAGQVVDLRHPVLCEIAENSGQLHKLVRIDESDLGAKEKPVSLASAPPAVRLRVEDYDNSGNAAPELTKLAGETQGRVDVEGLPKVAPAPKGRAGEKPSGKKEG